MVCLAHLVDFVCLVVSFIHRTNETNKTNQRNQMNQRNKYSGQPVAPGFLGAAALD
jgi:hypothetical protein